MHKVYMSLYVGDLEIVIDRPCEQMYCFDGTIFDHNTILPFLLGNCKTSTSETTNFDGSIVPTNDNKSENILCDNPSYFDELDQRPLAL